MKTKLKIGDVVSSELSSYELVHRLGQGGMGEVWKVIDRSCSEFVAIKFMRVDTEALRCRFRREVKLLRGLNHPNIVHFFDNGETLDGQPFLVLELLSGNTLSTWLTKYGAIRARRAVEIAYVIAGALAAAHALGIVHRDLKPGNVFLHDEQDTGGLHVEVKVFDFGIAKDLSASNQTLVTDLRTVLGTPAYMAPEQVLGEHVSFQADVWALGLLLFEMIEGRQMFSGQREHVFRQVLEKAILPIPWRADGVPKELDALVASCLARDPSKRIASAHEVELALRQLLESETVWQAPGTTVENQPADSGHNQVPVDTPSIISQFVSTTSVSIEAQTQVITEHHREVKLQLMFLNVGIASLVAVSLAALVTSCSSSTANMTNVAPAPSMLLEPAAPPRGQPDSVNPTFGQGTIRVPRYISGCRY